MNGVETRLKTDDELKTMLLALKKEAFNLRFQRASGPAGEYRTDARRQTRRGPHQDDRRRAQARCRRRGLRVRAMGEGELTCRAV